MAKVLNPYIQFKLIDIVYSFSYNVLDLNASIEFSMVTIERKSRSGSLVIERDIVHKESYDIQPRHSLKYSRSIELILITHQHLQGSLISTPDDRDSICQDQGYFGDINGKISTY